MDRHYFWLSDEQFSRIQPHLPTDTRGKPRVDDRRVISGIVHVLRSGCRWVDAPPVYGPRKTLYNRFVRWAAKGVWAAIERMFGRIKYFRRVATRYDRLAHYFLAAICLAATVCYWL